MRINEFNVGDRCLFTKYLEKNDYTSDLVSLGLLPGTKCEVLAFSPLKDMVHIEFRGNSIALRRKEAACLVFKNLTP